LLKEASIGIANGILLGVVAALVTWAARGDPMLGALLGVALIINLFVAATAGTLVPLGLRAANLDPALASSVVVTTMTDVLGFGAFLGLATVFLSYLKPG
jgi:magnesium transporter